MHRSLQIAGAAAAAKIVNVVVTGWLGAALDLTYIANHMWNVEYNPRRFSAAILRFRSPLTSKKSTTMVVGGGGGAAARGSGTTVLLFSTGRYVCTGAKSVADAKVAARRFARKIQQLFIASSNSNKPSGDSNNSNNNSKEKKKKIIRFCNFKVQNIVGHFCTGHGIDLPSLYNHRRVQCDWKQERFPAGLRYQPHRSTNPSHCVLVFPSGRCVITGCKSEEEIDEIYMEMKRLLLRYRRTTL